jgi:glucose-6-phosphate isomerase
MPSTPGFSLTPLALDSAFTTACSRLDAGGFASALWSRNVEVWTPDHAVQRAIANRLGWLGALDFVMPLVPRLRACADSIRQSGFTDIVLLGMGGSSLAPEVLRQVFGTRPGWPRFRVLDSVDPDSVRPAMARARETLFVLASKSGSTIEPNTMAAEARRRVIAEGEHDWGSRFIAITDENTALHQRATSERFRDVFVNPSDIGGRYSALSLFGMLPAALMGLDLDRILSRAREMETACRVESARDNPGLALGALMAAGALNRRDKLTLDLPPRLASFGLWVEQLVAESTGKRGKGVVPVTGEASTTVLGSDRVVVSLSVDGAAETALNRSATGDLPHARLVMPDVESLGAEFLRWEIATAAAGVLLDINPFDEPNVQQAKDATRVLLDRYRQHRQLPFPEAHESHDGTRLTLSEGALSALDGRPADSFLQLVGPGDYVGVLAYVPSEDPAWEDALQSLRTEISARHGCATTTGFGPRYLHSTGQLHKGGANNGVFLVIVAEPGTDLDVPDEPYSFGVLETAQALGDFESLVRTGRRAMLARLARRDVAALQELGRLLLPAS